MLSSDRQGLELKKCITVSTTGHSLCLYTGLYPDVDHYYMILRKDPLLGWGRRPQSAGAGSNYIGMASAELINAEEYSNTTSWLVNFAG